MNFSQLIRFNQYELLYFLCFYDAYGGDEHTLYHVHTPIFQNHWVAQLLDIPYQNHHYAYSHPYQL